MPLVLLASDGTETVAIQSATGIWETPPRYYHIREEGKEKKTPKATPGSLFTISSPAYPKQIRRLPEFLCQHNVMHLLALWRVEQKWPTI